MLSQKVITFSIHYTGLLGVKGWLESLHIGKAMPEDTENPEFYIVDLY